MVIVQVLQFDLAWVARSEVRPVFAKYISRDPGEKYWRACPLGWCRKEGGDVAMEGCEPRMTPWNALAPRGVISGTPQWANAGVAA